jgi:uncharacterized protein (TIGR02145 family)
LLRVKSENNIRAKYREEGIAMASKKRKGKNAPNIEDKKSKWASLLEMAENTLVGRWIECILATLLAAGTGYLYHVGWSFVEKTAASAVQFVVGLKPKPVASKHPTVIAKESADLVPAGYTIYEEIKGDLNKDGLDDIVLIIDGDSEGSRSGIIIAFNTGDHYDIALKNFSCFSYEDIEFGKCGSPNRMGVSIKKDVLVIDYSDGCAGTHYHETYKFRHQNTGFEMIGYDFVAEEYSEGEDRPIILRTTSVNFLSKKMHTKTNKSSNGKKNTFDEVWNDIAIREPIALRSIVTFYDYSVMDHITKIVDINQPESEKNSSFTDTRDGQKYRTVHIGNQVWIAENLNYKMGRSWCYNDSDTYCKKYGRLYNWYTAKEACPIGWRLPTSDDWGELIEYTGDWENAATMLKAASGWVDYDDKSGNGTDKFGFSALPGGDRDSYNNDSFNNAGSTGTWWVTTESGAGGMTCWIISNGKEYASNHGADRNDGYSVRCLKDSSIVTH